MKASPNAKAPWDDPKFKLPSGKVYSAPGMMIWPPANAIYRRETYDNYPAAKAVLQSVFEGLQLPMDLALAVEGKYFANILLSKEAAAMIRSLFLSMGELNKGVRRPASVPPTNLRKVGVLGAGLMGGGIAYVSALAELDVVLVDRDQEAADKGKAYSDKLISSQIAKGRAKTADKEALLKRIASTADYAELKGCDLIVEAVFENRAVKEEATKKAQAVVGPDVVFASNTSTLPITSLAGTSLNPEHFIGVHFFSPVEKMMLTEIIDGREDRRDGAGDRDGLRPRDQEDADCGQRLPRFLCQPLRRQLHGRSPRHGDGRRAAGDDRERRQDGRYASRAARAQRRSRHRSELANPSGGQGGSGRERRQSCPKRAHRDDGGQRGPLWPQERQGVLRLSGAMGRRPCGQGLPRSSASGAIQIASASRTSRTASSLLWRSKPRAVWKRASSRIRARPTSARSSGSALRPTRAARCLSSTVWGSRAFVARAKELAAKYGPQFEPGERLAQMAGRGATFYRAHGERQKAA